MRTDIRPFALVCLAVAAMPCIAQDTWGTLVSEATRLTVLELQLKAQGEDAPVATGNTTLALPAGRVQAPPVLPGIQPAVPVVSIPAATTPAMPSAPTVTVQNPTPPPPPPPVSVQSWAAQPKVNP